MIYKSCVRSNLNIILQIALSVPFLSLLCGCASAVSYSEIESVRLAALQEAGFDVSAMAEFSKNISKSAADPAAQAAYQNSITMTPEARDKYRELAVRYPADPLFNFLYGNVAPDYATAKRCYLSAVALDMDFEPAWSALYRTAAILKDWNLAARALERMAALEPDEPEYMNLLASAYFSAGKFDSGIEAMEKYLALRSGDSDAKKKYSDMLLSAAASKMELGKFEVAEELLKRALDLNPDGSEIPGLLSDAALARGLPRDALIWAKKSGDRVRISRAYRKAGDMKNARAEIDELLKSAPESAAGYYELGKIFESENKFREAADAFENAVQFDPVSAENLYALGRAASKAGDDETARTAFSAFVSKTKFGSKEWKEAVEILIAIEKRLRDKIGEDKEDISNLLADAESEYPESRRAALLNLNKTLGNEAFPYMLKYLKSKFEDVRIFAVKSMGLYGKPEASKLIIETLSDDSANVRREAIIALAELGPSESADALVKSLSDSDETVRAAAFSALKNLSNDDFGFNPKKPPSEQSESLEKWNNWLSGFQKEK